MLLTICSGRRIAAANLRIHAIPSRRSVHLRNPFFSIIALCLFFVVQGSAAKDRNFGLAMILGEPTGISAKLWTSSTNALDFDLGWSVGGDRIGQHNSNYDGGSPIHFYRDYLWHSFDAIHSVEAFKCTMVPTGVSTAVEVTIFRWRFEVFSAPSGFRLKHRLTCFLSPSHLSSLTHQQDLVLKPELGHGIIFNSSVRTQFNILNQAHS